MFVIGRAVVLVFSPLLVHPGLATWWFKEDGMVQLRWLGGFPLLFFELNVKLWRG